MICSDCNTEHGPGGVCTTSPSSDSFRWLSPSTIVTALAAMRLNRDDLKLDKITAAKLGWPTESYDVWISDLTEAIKEMEAR